jgi:hypothetical protein
MMATATARTVRTYELNLLFTGGWLFAPTNRGIRADVYGDAL